MQSEMTSVNICTRIQVYKLLQIAKTLQLANCHLLIWKF